MKAIINFSFDSSVLVSEHEKSSQSEALVFAQESISKQQKSSVCLKRKQVL